MLEGRAYALSRLLHRGARQADHRERRQTAADEDLDPDLQRVDADDGGGESGGSQ